MRVRGQLLVAPHDARVERALSGLQEPVLPIDCHLHPPCVDAHDLGCGEVRVEKPLALTRAELADIEKAYREVNASAVDSSTTGAKPCLLMVGFNRRFAPQIVKLKSLLATVKAPKAFVMTVNAGAIPREHWTQQRAVGGGRIIGEACHFIDLLRHLAGAPITAVTATSLRTPGGDVNGDNATLSLVFEDGSTGTIHYLANGHRAFPKERLEVFCGGRIVQLANFRKMTGYGWPGFRRLNLWRQDKGQGACVAAFVDAIRAGYASPIPFEELLEVAEATIAADEALRA